MLSTYDREDNPQNISYSSSSSSLSHTEGNRTNYFTENNNNDYIYPNDITINSLDIADGLKELLIKYRYTLEELSSISYSKLAELLGIDLYVEKLIDTSHQERRASTFEEADKRARTGTPSSLALHDMGLSTIIGRENKDARGQTIDAVTRYRTERLRMWDARTRLQNSVDKNLM